ncbi:MAG TPA: PBP1A family penicillin-binding protein [Nitrospirales bacterium]|nr:PBP1A family penicillin-binding protein [Nitrospirales bacterium]
MPLHPRRRARTGRPVWVTLLFAVLLVSMLGVIGIGGTVWYLSRDLPDVETLHSHQPSLVTHVYADDGMTIGQFFVERRILTPLDEIPRELRQAIIAVEDARFMAHGGLDVLGIVRAFMINIEALRIRQGASTITQQLARSVFLTPERSYTRKIKEAVLAIHMEKTLSKDKILELYLNQIYFGHGAYGVASAAQTYFSKDISTLSAAESAFIAGLPKAPALYSPFRHPERSQRRLRHVLKRLHDEGFLTGGQYGEAISTPLKYRKREPEVIAPYFVDAVRQHLLRTYGESMVYKGGLHVQTTLNIADHQAAVLAVRNGLRSLDKQQGYRGPLNPEQADGFEASHDGILQAVVNKVDAKSAVVTAGDLTGTIALEDMLWAARRLIGPDVNEDSVLLKSPSADQILSAGNIVEVAVKTTSDENTQFTLEQTPLVEGALMAIDPKTGSIRAMVGGYDFNRSEYNRATSANRQPGSAFKPIIYTAALQAGMTPATILIDSPVVFQDWRPENYEKKFFGTVTLRDALIHSRNVATVKLLQTIGVRRVHELAQSMGITTMLDVYLSLALGSSSMTLEELTSAYGVFANQGIYVRPYSIESVRDSEGVVLEQHKHNPTPAISAETAYLITNILEDVIQHGTGRQAKVIPYPVAGKTGTTNDFTDGWFIGYSPRVVTGVWAGFDRIASLGDKISGARSALPIWIDFMKNIEPPTDEERFIPPDNIVFAQIDPETGFLAERGASDTKQEIFVQGSEPIEHTPQRVNPRDFFNLDHATP